MDWGLCNNKYIQKINKNKNQRQHKDDGQLTLLIAERLLQHGKYDWVIQDKVAEVTGSRGTQPGIANQCVFIQQTAGRGSPTRWWEGTQHLHNTKEHHTSPFSANIKIMNQF